MKCEPGVSTSAKPDRSENDRNRTDKPRRHFPNPYPFISIKKGEDMVEIYERSLGQSYQSAYRAAIIYTRCSSEKTAKRTIFRLADNWDPYYTFGVTKDGTVIDWHTTFPRLLAPEVEGRR